MEYGIRDLTLEYLTELPGEENAAIIHVKLFEEGGEVWNVERDLVESLDEGGDIVVDNGRIVGWFGGRRCLTIIIITSLVIRRTVIDSFVITITSHV